MAVREFRMPSMGADMDAGTLLEWKVAPGDAVRKGDVVAVVDTDKSAIDVEVFHDGIVDSLLVEPGATVPVGTPLAVLREPGEARQEPTPAEPTVEARTPELERAAPESPPVKPTATTSRHAAAHPLGGHHVAVHSPLVRSLAERTGVDLRTVAGTGPGGIVTRDDITRMATRRPRISPRARRLAREQQVGLSAITPRGPVLTGDDVLAVSVTAAPPTTAPPTTAPPTRSPQDRQATMRRAIAAAMARSAREIPHYHLATTVDLQAALAWLSRHNADRAVTERVLPAALLLHAASRAASAVPESNGFCIEGEFQPSEAVHLGVAISLRGGGLVAPAILNADRLDVDELMVRLRDLILRARRGGLRSSEMAEATITVTNLGDQGVELVHGVIYPPQVALVGFGTITHVPVAVDGTVEVHPTTIATLAGDHRVGDGLHGGRFLRHLASLLENPEETHGT